MSYVYVVGVGGMGLMSVVVAHSFIHSLNYSFFNQLIFIKLLVRR